MSSLQMQIGKHHKIILKRASVWSAVLAVIIPFFLWGSSADIAYPAVARKDVTATLVIPSPSVKVALKTSTVNAGTITTGDFSVTVEFTVAANVSKVTLFLEASDLYRGGDPTDPRKTGPVALNSSRPVEIIMPSGNRIAGPPNTVAWLGTGDQIANFPGKKTETVTYDFSSKGEIIHDVSCKLWYSQSNNFKTGGQYSGYVRLNAAVAP
jgi:hypothetical protein